MKTDKSNVQGGLCQREGAVVAVDSGVRAELGWVSRAVVKWAFAGPLQKSATRGLTSPQRGLA